MMKLSSQTLVSTSCSVRRIKKKLNFRSQWFYSQFSVIKLKIQHEFEQFFLLNEAKEAKSRSELCHLTQSEVFADWG